MQRDIFIYKCIFVYLDTNLRLRGLKVTHQEKTTPKKKQIETEKEGTKSRIMDTKREDR